MRVEYCDRCGTQHNGKHGDGNNFKYLRFEILNPKYGSEWAYKDLCVSCYKIVMDAFEKALVLTKE